jgi:hypothetical protein
MLNPVVDGAQSRCEGAGVDGNGGRGWMETKEEDLAFVVYAVDAKGRPAVNSRCATTATLTGPAGPVEVQVEDKEDGSFAASYPALTAAGTYSLDVQIGETAVAGSPFGFFVAKLAHGERELVPGQVVERTWLIGHEDGKTSFEFEVENKSPDKYWVTYAFDGTSNMDGAEPSEFTLEGSETRSVATLVQTDGAAPFDMQMQATAEEKPDCDLAQCTAEGLGLDGNGATGMGVQEPSYNDATPGEYKPRLLHLKGEDHVTIENVPIQGGRVNGGDVFVLDAGLKIYQWQGTKAGKAEKSRAGILCRALDDSRGADGHS